MILKLVWVFLKVGVLGFGGGPGSVGIIQQLTVSEGLVTASRFADDLAVGSALPGPLATKLAAAIGFEKAGWLGAVLATLAVVLPSALAMVLLVGWLLAHKEVPWVKGLLMAGKPVALAMLALAIWDLFPGTFQGILPVVLFGATVILVRLGLPVAPVILGALLVGVISQLGH